MLSLSEEQARPQLKRQAAEAPLSPTFERDRGANYLYVTCRTVSEASQNIFSRPSWRWLGICCMQAAIDVGESHVKGANQRELPWPLLQKSKLPIRQSTVQI